MAAQRYKMPQNTDFGAYLEEINVTDYDPHGFVADSDVGDPIVRAVLHRKGFVPAPDWLPHTGDDAWILRYYENDDDAAAGRDPLGEIIRMPAPAEDTGEN